MKSFHAHRSTHSIRPEPRILMGIIADEETTVGFLLAGLGEENRDKKEKPVKNFYVVNEETPIHELEKDFNELYNRKNIGVILIGSDVYPKLSNALKRTSKLLPVVIAVPTKRAVIQYIATKAFDEDLK